MFSMDHDLGPVHDQMAPVLREACHSGKEWLRRAGSEEQEEETRREPIIPLADGFPKIKGLVSLPYSPPLPRKTLLPQGHGTSGSPRMGEQACTLGRFLGVPYPNHSCWLWSLQCEEKTRQACSQSREKHRRRSENRISPSSYILYCTIHE